MNSFVLEKLREDLRTLQELLYDYTITKGNAYIKVSGIKIYEFLVSENER